MVYYGEYYNLLWFTIVNRDGVITIQMCTSTITLECTRVRLYYNIIMITFMITFMNILFLT